MEREFEPAPMDAAGVKPVDETEAAEALRGLRNLKVLLGTDAPEVRGWAPAVQQAAQKTLNTAIRVLAARGVKTLDGGKP